MLSRSGLEQAVLIAHRSLFVLACLAAGAARGCGTAVIPDNVGQSAPAAIADFNPLLDGSAQSEQAWLMLYRPLVWIGRDDALDPERSLAAGIVASADGLTFTVTLKPWRWSDGVAVSADDAVFTWELIRRVGALFAFAGQGGIPDRVAAVRAVDARTVEFRLRRRTNPEWFALNGLSTFAPLPRHAWGDPDLDTLWRRQADPGFFRVVDGPFRLAALRPERYAVFAPNPLYGGHRSTLSRLVIDFLAGGSALTAVQSGEIDMAQIPPLLAAGVRPKRGFHMAVLPEAFGYRALVFNLRAARVGFLRDARVRRALTLAADQGSMVRLIYHGNAAEIRAPIPPGYAMDARPGAEVLRHDPARAAQLLAEAGVRGGRLEISVLVSEDNAEAIEELQILQQNLAALGVALHIRPLSLAELGARVFGGGEWDAAVLGFTRAGVPDGSSFFDTGGGGNPGGFSDAETDRLIAASDAEPGRGALADYAARIALLQPWNFLPEGGAPLLVSDRVHGIDDFLNRQGYLSPEYLSVDCDGAGDAGAHR